MRGRFNPALQPIKLRERVCSDDNCPCVNGADCLSFPPLVTIFGVNTWSSLEEIKPAAFDYAAIEKKYAELEKAYHEKFHLGRQW